MDDLSPDDLQIILNQIAQGNDKGMSRLYRHYNAALFAYIRHIVTVDEAAEELVHDTFMVIHNKPLAYNGQCKFFTWLCSIAKNKAADWWRAMGRQQKKDLKMEELNAILEETNNLSWTVTEHYEKAELSEVMLGCLDKLPESQRLAAYWTFYLDLRISEVALNVESPENTIKTRLLHARHRLRDCLERAYVGLDLGSSL